MISGRVARRARPFSWGTRMVLLLVVAGCLVVAAVSVLDTGVPVSVRFGLVSVVCSVVGLVAAFCAMRAAGVEAGDIGQGLALFDVWFMRALFCAVAVLGLGVSAMAVRVFVALRAWEC